MEHMKDQSNMASGSAVALTNMSVPQLVNYIIFAPRNKHILVIELELCGVNILTIKVCMEWFLKLLYFNLTIIKLTQHRKSNSLEFAFVQKVDMNSTRLVIISVHQPWSAWFVLKAVMISGQSKLSQQIHVFTKPQNLSELNRLSDSAGDP